MKKLIILIAIIALILTVFAQEESHDVSVINIEVQTRVFKGSKFVENLTIDDFEVYEDGILQKIEAMYLIKEKSIKKEEIIKKEDKPKKFAPKLSRHFVLVFEITEYLPKIKEAIDLFFNGVLLPGDTLIVMTPARVYSFKQKILETKSRKDIAEQLKSILRKDALTGNAEYRSIINSLKQVARAASMKFIPPGQGLRRIQDYTALAMQDSRSLEEILMLYESLIDNLESIRRVDQQQLINFAEFLKNREGQKHVFLFYQREFLPQIDTKFLIQYMEMYQDTPHVQLTLSRLSEFFIRDISLDVKKVRQVYADSSISMYFMFITKPAEQIAGIEMKEHSEDIFSAFREMALATGGTVESSANPDYLFQRATEASENYYLLYYAPKNYIADGKFRKIKVKIKNKNYRVTHRAGYFAN